jgi:hypothetical protein
VARKKVCARCTYIALIFVCELALYFICAPSLPSPCPPQSRQPRELGDLRLALVPQVAAAPSRLLCTEPLLGSLVLRLAPQSMLGRVREARRLDREVRRAHEGDGAAGGRRHHRRAARTRPGLEDAPRGHRQVHTANEATKGILRRADAEDHQILTRRDVARHDSTVHTHADRLFYPHALIVLSSAYTCAHICTCAFVLPARVRLRMNRGVHGEPANR